MLVLAHQVHAEMLAHCLGEAPLEACGMLAGRAEGDGAVAVRCFPARNAAASSRLYTVEPSDLLRADREAEAAGCELVGVFHSHTHTEAYPSPTDVGAAPDPAWHYVLVSLRDLEPTVRSYRIVGGTVEEEPVALQ